MVPFGIMRDLIVFYILPDVPPIEADVEDDHFNGDKMSGISLATGDRLKS